MRPHDGSKKSARQTDRSSRPARMQTANKERRGSQKRRPQHETKPDRSRGHGRKWKSRIGAAKEHKGTNEGRGGGAMQVRVRGEEGDGAQDGGGSAGQAGARHSCTNWSKLAAQLRTAKRSTGATEATAGKRSRSPLYPRPWYLPPYCRAHEQIPGYLLDLFRVSALGFHLCPRSVFCVAAQPVLLWPSHGLIHARALASPRFTGLLGRRAGGIL